MTGFEKGLIISLALVVVIIAAGVAAGIYWLSAHSGEFLDKTKQSIVDGKNFGKNTDNQGCVTEAVSRHKQNPGFSEAISTQFFLQGCLDASHETPGFCDDVPRPTEFLKGAKWQQQQCSRHNLHDAYCPQIFGQVQGHCEIRRTAQ